MTMDVAMAVISAVSPRGNDRGGKSGAEADAGAFDRAVSEKPDRRMPQERQDREPATEPRWRLAAFGDKYEPAPQEPAADAAYDSFRDMLLPLETAGRDGDGSESALEAGLPADDAQQPADLLPPDDVAPQAPAAAVVAAQPPAREGRRDAVFDAGDARPPRGKAGADADPASPRQAPAHAAAPTGKPRAGSAGNAAARPAGDPSASSATGPAAGPAIDPAGGPTGGPTGSNGTAEAAPARAQTAVQVAAAAAQDRPAADAPRPAETRSGRQDAAAVRAAAASAAPAASAGSMPEEIVRQLEAARMAGRTAASAAQQMRGDAAGPAQAGADKAQPVVSVLGVSNSSAPVIAANVVPAGLAAQLSATGAGVVAAIEAEPGWRAAAAADAPQRGQAAGVVSSLRIQLNPAELGMVTARLVASGSQLEIELRVESGDARQKLAHDADAIVKALRGAGYDVERVTIHQGPPGGPATQQQGAGARDPFMQQGQQQGEAGANAGGRNGQHSANPAETAQRGAHEPAAERAGGGVYI